MRIAIEKVSDEEFFAMIDEESNSIAVIVKHIAGNLHSRWHDFSTTDGEKPDRNRDHEVEMIGDTRGPLLKFWESGWQTLFAALDPMPEKDFFQTIMIRGEPHSVVEAVNRQMTHYCYHIGQIVFLAKHFNSTDWISLSVPRSRSADYNQHLADQQGGGHSEIEPDRHRDRVWRETKMTARIVRPSSSI